MKSIRYFLLSIILILLAGPLSGFEYHGLDGEVGFLWKHNDGYDTEPGDSGPDRLTFIPGISAYFTFDDHWFFKPALFIYTQTLQYLPQREYTIPVDYSHIDSMSVLGVLLDPAFGYQWTIGEKHHIGVQAGPGLNFQFPLWGPGKDDRNAMLRSLMKEVFYINMGAWYYNPMTERFGFTLKTQVCLPLYNAWTDRELPFSDGLMILGMVGIRVIVQ